MAMTLRPIRVRTGSRDRDGRLALSDDELVAVLVRLDDEAHGADRGRWYLEAGFGPQIAMSTPMFRDLDEAEAWLTARV